jgi:hypothetical protein
VLICARGRPMRLRSARACAIPALTRSAIKSRSNCATAPTMWNSNRPVGVVGVYPFGVGDEVNAQGSKLGETVHEMLDRTRETVELPDQDNVEAPLVSLTHELVKLGTPALSSTYAFVYELAAAPDSAARLPAASRSSDPSC